MSAKELSKLPEAEIKEHLGRLRQDLWQCRVKAREGSLQQIHQIRTVRRQLARIQTILRQKAKGR